MSWPVSNEYIYEICKAREMHRHYIQADTLLFICYCWRSKFKMKIDMKIYLTSYFVLLKAAFGAWQLHDMCVHLIFPVSISQTVM